MSETQELATIARLEGERNDYHETVVEQIRDIHALEQRIAELEAQLAAERDANRISDASLTGALESADDEIAKLRVWLAEAQRGGNTMTIVWCVYRTDPYEAWPLEAVFANEAEAKECAKALHQASANRSKATMGHDGYADDYKILPSPMYATFADWQQSHVTP